MTAAAVRWVGVGLSMVAVSGYELSEEQYYVMPKLFQLDDFEECLSRRHGTFCLGSFDLLPQTNHRLLQDIQRFSEDKYHFNHTHIHRGLCISSRCPLEQGPSLRGRFERCVNSITSSEFGLETNLTRLQYCRSARTRSPPADWLDAAFAAVCVVVLLMNVVGTARDVFGGSGGKPSKLVAAWSLRGNWRRLTADHSDRDDQRLSALKPVQGIKSLTLILVMLAHSVLAHHLTYLKNPVFFETASHHPLSAYFQNGTSIVHTFIMVSSFLLAYNLLLHSEATKKPLSLSMFPECLLHRVIRILPVYLFVVGLTATWWAHVGDGPLWAPLVGAERAACRAKWWTHLLFLNNLVQPDLKCMIHTWFVAVDMQLYAASALMTLTLGRRPRLALVVLAGLFVLAVAANLALITTYELRPMVTLMFPELMRTQFEGVPSFTWLYQAPWDSLPAALLGLFLAFLHHLRQSEGYQPADSQIFRIAYRVSVPSMFLWVFAGYFVKGAYSPVAALYAALDRPAFCALTAAAMYGFFNKVDDLWWRFLSWRGWEVLGRMSLSVYAVHWVVCVWQLALRTHLSPVSVQYIGGHFLYTVLFSYISAVGLHLAVELPLQRFLQALF